MDYGPALKHKDTSYPRSWNGRTPKAIRMLRDITPDAICAIADPMRNTRAEKGLEYQAWTNSYGAVCAVFPDGQKIGVKPHEFEVVEWFEADGVTVMREPEKVAPETWTGGPMTIERAVEINNGITATVLARLVDGEHVPLPNVSLEELCVAARMIDSDPTAPRGMRTAPRGIAAMYAFQHFDCDVHALLGGLGFRLTSGRREEEDEET